MAKFELGKTGLPEVSELKRQYLKQLPCPLDGMWECFVDMAVQYSIVVGNDLIGYCVVNSENKLLQFSIGNEQYSSDCFRQVLDELKVTGAFVATGEFQTLSLGMDHQKSVKVNAFLYQMDQETEIEKAVFPPASEFRVVNADEIELVVDFGIETLAADPNWLNGYFAKLIQRAELYGLWQAGSLIATGECRRSDTQMPYADLGMVVSKNHRGQGLATNVMRQMLHQCRDNGLRAICSTESDNIAAQLAIARAGFISHHRVLEFAF